jgi:hypothetical protein
VFGLCTDAHEQINYRQNANTTKPTTNTFKNNKIKNITKRQQKNTKHKQTQSKQPQQQETKTCTHKALQITTTKTKRNNKQ